jgi:hypothetical protein
MHGAGRSASPLMHNPRTRVRSMETHHMKTLITALALATLIAAPVFTLSANAAPNDRRGSGQSEQNNGTYNRYPLSDWYRGDSW